MNAGIGWRPVRRLPRASACGLRRGGWPIAVQPICDRVLVDAKFAGDLRKWPGLPGHAVAQICLEVGEAELGGALGEALVGGAAALTGAADLR